MERCLTAIFAVDVVGYSRLMGTGESGARLRLKACETEVIEPVVSERNGRVVKRMGDDFLVEFARDVDAVERAVTWQRAVSQQDNQFQIRISHNIGDIILENEDIYGDGVNIAAQLEKLAEPRPPLVGGPWYGPTPAGLRLAVRAGVSTAACISRQGPMQYN
jgi:adenylate cyclase